MFLLQGDADIFFPTDFWLLERIDHYCSGQLKMHKDNSSKQGKKRRTITVSLILLNSSVTFLTTTLQDKYSHGENYIFFLAGLSKEICGKWCLFLKENHFIYYTLPFFATLILNMGMWIWCHDWHCLGTLAGMAVVLKW